MKQEIKERIKLINKGIVPAGYKKTPVGFCPVEWIETILGKICEINPKTERLKSTFQYIDLESIVNGKVVAIKMINKQNAPSRAQRVLSKNDIIYQLVRPYQKNNFLLKNINENQIVASTGYAQLRCKNPEFIYNLINTDYFCNQVLEKCTGTNYPAITSGELYKILVNIPINDTEQQKIAEILDCATRQVELQEQLVDKLKVQKKALMQKLLTPQPDWQEVKLGDICKITTGKLDANEMVENGKYPFFTCSKDIYKIDKYDYDMEALLMAGNGEIGDIKYYNGKFNAYQRTYILYNFKFNIKYAMQYLLLHFNKAVCKGSQKSSMPYIRVDLLNNAKILYPQNLDQIAIFLENFDKKIELQQKLLEQYKLRQKSLMQLLLTGIVRVC